jgi:carbamate kinase
MTAEVEANPLDVLGAQTESMIGYAPGRELGNLRRIRTRGSAASAPRTRRR